MKSRAQKLLESKIRKMVREELLSEERIVGRISGYDVGLLEDGSLMIAGDSGDYVVRITNKKMAQKFAEAVTKVASMM